MQLQNQSPVQLFKSNNKGDPSLSILIPTYKRINLLENAILSAIKQNTYLDYEIIIVDNDQSKDSLYLIKKLSQKFPTANLYLYQNSENIGLYGNWNACLSLARSKWITIISDDDLLKPNWLSVMWEVKDKLQDPIVIGCDVGFNKKEYYRYEFFKKFINFNDKKILSKTKIRKLSDIDYFIEMPHLGSLGILLNRKAAIEYGGFNKDFHPCSDYKLLTDMSFLKKSYLIDKKLAVHQIGSDNTSQKPETVYQAMIINRKIQLNLISHMPFKLNFLYKFYIKTFLERSISGYRKQFREYPTIQKFILENNLNVKFNFFFYFPLKTFLLILANIQRQRINNEI